MRQRKNSSEEENSEMEIDGEEKMGDQTEERNENDNENADEVDDEDDDDEMQSAEEDEEDQNYDAPPHGTTMPDNPFLDSFYGLSASNPKERSQAAQIMLQHCLLGPNANAKDAAYAFRRLLNGLCSGRAAARQGNASALASFLKVAFHMDKIEEIRNEANSSTSNADSRSDLMYVRDRLLAATNPNEDVGKKKGSEERDYHFGRLFGILGVVRSNILRPDSDNGADNEEEEEAASSLISDLVELFWLKKWMREPAAHGISTMLKLFYETSKESRKIGNHLVKTVIIPRILVLKQDDKEKELDRRILLQNYCAEQVGLAAYIQSRLEWNNLPFPLDQPVVTSNTLLWIGRALSETSVVVHPRTHFVWDTLWCYLTEVENRSSAETEKSTRPPTSTVTRSLRVKIPNGEESALNIIDAILRIVVKEWLLRIEKDSSTGKATHERRSLAMCIVKNLSGVPFVSSLSGPARVRFQPDAIESILLAPDIIRTIFFNVICAGKQKSQSSHLLKPLALEVLRSISAAVDDTDNESRLAFAKAFLNCSVRFDHRTKTSTVAELLRFSSEVIPSENDFSLWGKYLAYLEVRFLESCAKIQDADSVSQAAGYIDLLFSAAKNILRTGTESDLDEDAESISKKENLLKGILGFFMAVAFFDCSGLTRPSGDKKKKKEKKADKTVSIDPMFDSSLKIKDSVGELKEIPCNVRNAVSAKFFALISDFTLFASRQSRVSSSGKVERDSRALDILAGICGNWRNLELYGGRRLGVSNEENDDEEETDDPEVVIKELEDRVHALQKAISSCPSDTLKESQKRCITGIAVLAMTLHLHRLTCGSDNPMDEDPDADEENDEEEICSTLSELKSVLDDFSSDEQSETNPLLGLAELCANILSSPVGSGSIGRGSSPKLIREAVKYAWLGGLRLSSSLATEQKSLLDSSVIDVLMDSIGATNAEEDIDDEPDGDEDVDSEGKSEGDESSVASSENEGIFSKASKLLGEADEMDSEEKKSSQAEDEESDVEIDAANLQTMLEEDSDTKVDKDVLEHHEGADAALAKWIKARQEARKAGQQTREKIEVSNHLRCTYLVELLLERPDGWNRLFRSNILEMVLPMLKYRKKVAMMTKKAIENGAKVGTGEKKALLERLTHIIKQKLCKLRLLSMPMASAVDMKSAGILLQQIIKEAKQAKDKAQVSCCSSCLIFLIRGMPSSQEVLSIVSLEYGLVIREWSTKRSSGASLVEDFITHMPTMAQATLLPSLSKATLEARATFLKVEAFRLLSLLFANSNSELSERESLAQQMMNDSQQVVLDAICKTLEDDEMLKPKTVRAVLKATEKILPCLSPPFSAESLRSLDRINEIVQILGGEKADAKNSLAVISAKVIRSIDECKTATKADTSTEKTTVTPSEKGGRSIHATSENKKSKKKKKKKKR